VRLLLKPLVASLGVAALGLAPLALTTASIALVSAEAAYAKGNDRGGGGGRESASDRGSDRGSDSRGGGGNGNRGEARSGGKSGGEASQGRGQSQSQGQRQGQVRSQGHGGQSATAPRAARTEQPGRSNGQANRAAAHNKSASRPAPRPDGLHPRDLGNMNGALNANINAVLAHIRNGNTNGPVGHLAALAVAGASAGDAQAILDSAEAREYLALRDALAAAGYDDLAAYEAALADDPSLADAAIDSALDALGSAALNDALAAGGYDDLAAYEAAVLEDPANVDPAVDAALAALGTADPAVWDRLAAAETDLGGLAAAEAAMLAYWNKNADDDPATISADERALLDALHARLAGHEAAIADAIGTAAPAPGDAPSDDTDGEDGDDDETGGDDDGLDEDESDDSEAAFLILPPQE
jgi:hypothetical protein